MGQHQRALDGVAADLDDLDGRLGALNADEIAFTAVAADWVSPAPTTVGEALARIAANTTNAHPVP